MNNVITDPEQVTPEWLLETLRANGHLDRGEVTTVRQRDTVHRVSLNYLLDVGYTQDAPPSAPPRLFFKMTSPEQLPLNSREVEFYTLVAASMPIHQW